MRRSPWLLLALAVSCLQLIAFSAWDRRPPDDHDDFYTADTLPWIAALRRAPRIEAPGILRQEVGVGPLHPRLAQTALTVTLALFGPSRFAFRMANLPFLLLLVLGTAALAREVGVRRPGLAALAIASAPIVVNASRKWDIQFHAAALTPLGLALMIAALRRGTRAWGWWLAFGAWQGLRLYTHPIVASDVLLTLLLALVLLAPTAASLGLRPGARLGLWGLAASVTLWGGLWYSGLAPSLVGAPPHGFLGYLQSRESYASTWWITQASPLAVLGLLVQMLAEVSWIHLFPLGFSLLLCGLLGALWAGLRGPPPGPERWLVASLVALAAAQALPAILAVSNRAFLNDWLFVLPGLVVAALWGAERTLDRRWGQVAAAGLLVQALFVLCVPLVAVALGPEPVEDPAWYDRGPLRLFTRSTSGRHLITHHLPSRFVQPGERLAERLRPDSGPGRLARYDLLDLRWDPARGGGPGCHLGPPDDPGAWSWGWPPGLDDVAGRLPSAWPFAFVGFDGARVGRPDVDDPRPAARYAVVRLWVTPSDAWAAEATPCRPEERLPEGWIAAARARIRERFGAVDGELLPDPGGWLVGRVVEWDRSAAYMNGALLVDRSAGQVQIEDQRELLPHHGAAEGPAKPLPRR